jgi:hypothetical protein
MNRLRYDIVEEGADQTSPTSAALPMGGLHSTSEMGSIEAPDSKMAEIGEICASANLKIPAQIVS